MSNDAAPDTTPPEADATAGSETITIPAAEFEAAKRNSAEWRERCQRLRQVNGRTRGFLKIHSPR